MDTLAAEWGVDLTALSALSKWPTMRQPFIAASDYPREALNKNASGTVLTRLTISVEGKVTGCAVVGPSGETSLDEATCRVALTRGSFEPALGADGTSVEAKIIQPVTWVAT